ncbi:histone-lysine N-methyltransferase SETDB2 isoform X2 [Tamandua tetradactyla]|uniref:histone-lysine N-methyltransferase SETDB2 isoform X2 n=1 Tax=Tamandua tetradactyla TaxID=48850 RepID=UPI004053FBCC
MGEKNGDAKTFWMELEDDGKVDIIFEQVQNVLQSLKQKIKDGSATNKEYIQAMILVNEAIIGNKSTLIKDGRPVTQNEQESKSNALPSTSYDDSSPEDCTFLSTENKEVLPLEKEVTDFREKEPPSNISYQRHECSGACLMKVPLTSKGENPLQLPIKCQFQRRHAKTNSRSSALHVSYKAPCGRSLRNMEEVFRYLLETECNFLFTDNFSFNTYVQLTRNYPKQEEIVSDMDISNGVESVPISFCNEIDNRKLPPFKYRRTIWPRAYYLDNFSIMFTDSCDCSEGCIDITKCACLQLTARNAEICTLSSNNITTGYKYKRLQRQIPTGIYECNLLCKCNRQMCQNRVVQHGPQVRLQVFKTEKKGWGVRCLDDIDRGTFVCIYSGRLLSRANPGKLDAADENGKEENTMKNIFSKKRKMDVTCSDCEVEIIPLELETQPDSAEAEICLPKFNNDLKEPIMKMKCDSISRIQHHSVIRSPQTKTAVFQHNGEKMGFPSLKYVTSEDDRFEPPVVHLNSKAKESQSVSHVVEKMKKMTCALCPEDLEHSVLYFAEKENIVAHESCLLYSSGLVECDDHDTSNHDRNFDLESVKKEIKRGNKLKCKFCGKKGATVGCDVKSCTKNYHFFCAKRDLASLHTDAHGAYKVFCRQHTESVIDTSSGNSSGLKRKRGRNKHFSADIKQNEALPFTGSEGQLKEERGKHAAGGDSEAPSPSRSPPCLVQPTCTSTTSGQQMARGPPLPSAPPLLAGTTAETIMKAAFLKKCKEAGLLNDLIEELLDKLVFIQERLMDDITSEEDYEEIGTSLFDCRLFEDTFVKFQRAIENKIDQYEKQQQELKKEIKLLQDLKQTLGPLQENRGLGSSSTSVSFLSS